MNSMFQGAQFDVKASLLKTQPFYFVGRGK